MPACSQIDAPEKSQDHATKPSNEELSIDMHNQQLQENAKRNNSGLWKDKNVVEPKDWRKEKKEGKTEKGKISGSIILVSEGNEVLFSDNMGKTHTIRLAGVAVPERDKNYRAESKRYLTRLLFGRDIVVETKGTYTGGIGTLGVIYLGNHNINSEMIEAGYAWVDKKTTNSDFSMNTHNRRLQENAKRREAGLWKDKAAAEKAKRASR
jgi:endonuclease YncB( thermonuclease family)